MKPTALCVAAALFAATAIQAQSPAPTTEPAKAAAVWRLSVPSSGR